MIKKAAKKSIVATTNTKENTSAKVNPIENEEEEVMTNRTSPKKTIKKIGKSIVPKKIEKEIVEEEEVMKEEVLNTEEDFDEDVDFEENEPDDFDENDEDNDDESEDSEDDDNDDENDDDGDDNDESEDDENDSENEPEESNDENINEEDSDDESEDDDETSIILKQSKNKKKKTSSEKEEIKPAFERKEIKKGDRMKNRIAPDFEKSIRKNSFEDFYAVLWDELLDNEIIGKFLDELEMVTDNDSTNVASNIYMSVQNAFIKTLINKNGNIPFLNAKIYSDVKSSIVYDIIPGSKAKRATYQPPRIEFKLTTSVYSPSNGLTYLYNGINEISAGGSRIDDDKFVVEIDSASAADGEPIWKKGDVIDITTGRKVVNKTNKKTTTKSSTKKTINKKK